MTAAGYSSQAGYVIVRTQDVQGTFKSDTPTAGMAVPMRGNAGLGSDRSLMIPDPEVGGNRDIGNAYLGPVKWSGGYDFYGRINSILPFLKAGMGVAAAPVTNTGLTTHTLTCSDAATLPLLSIEEGIGSALEVYRYTDAIVNQFHLEAAADGYLMATASMIASRQIAGVTRATGVASLLDTTPIPVGTNVSVTLNGITLPAKSFSLDINNNVDDGDWRLGSFYLGSLIPKRREVSASVVIRQGDIALWRKAVYGTAAATAPGGLTTKEPLVINIASYENIQGATPTTPYSLQLTMPSATIQPYGLGPNADAIIEPTLALSVFRTDPAVSILTAVAKTGLATIP